MNPAIPKLQSPIAPVLITLLLLLSSRGMASNLDLSTVPKRDTVQLTIYNSEDITLVRETRKITFKKGQNPLQFSRANTLIDPTSVELKFLTNPDQLEVLDTTFPRDKPQMLSWNVNSDFDGEATVEITYFTSGITWSADYLCTADKNEESAKLEGFVRITNNSGEEYEDAQVRLVVGTINLVEKIAELAQISTEDVRNLEREKKAQFRNRAMGAVFSHGALFGGGGGGVEPPEAPKQIIKEGLSEYFIFTIEGTETIPNTWSKRLRSIEAQDVPLKIQYRYRPQEYGEQLIRMYLLTNDKDSKLGTSPLPNGTVRIVRDNGRDGLSYVAAQTIKYIPIGDKIELNLGTDPEVIFELIKLKASRDNIWMQLNGVDVFRRVDDGAAQIDVNSSVAGWDEHQLFTQRLRNYTTKPIDVEVRRSFDGDDIFRSNFNPVLHDYHTVQFGATVEPAKKVDLYFESIQHQGRNAKQDHVTLETADIKP